MSFLTEWITNIIVFVLLATVIDMLLPSSSMQKYVKIVTGLLLITIILTPLLKLLTSDADTIIESFRVNGAYQNNSVENLIEMKKKEIQASQRAYILEQVAVQMKQEAEKELMEKSGKVIEKVNIAASDLDNIPDSITEVTVYLSEKEEEHAIEAVRNVEIDTGEKTKAEKTVENMSLVTSLLAEKWNLSPEKIIIAEGGTESSNEL
ncbi:stage III sporulation protein AF [Rossellomorea aquimaris]|uniref:Stage III sporulation protein AF n=1 Tax=Rossellomorea aquimaris TaxID=189382 RepID=A0A1J6WYW6_9BACI|nr:stage III sporulation protein AF [Rossellomorea aquimaris]OIU71097.1 stage III sporulation protein AF [Rossellomorea aquimaris]